jgi:hypothetical protein
MGAAWGQTPDLLRSVAPLTDRPADLLGLPSLLGDPSQQIALRYVLFALTLGWAALVARGRHLWAVLGGIVLVEAVFTFWLAGLGRPYGLFVDAGITRRAAETASVALGGEEGFLAGEPRAPSLGVAAAAWGLPPEIMIALPTLLPLLVVPALALAIFALWPPREEAWLAAVLWLAFSTSQSESLRGAGFLTGLWTRPGPALVLVVLVTLVLAAGRLRPRGVAVAAGAAIAATCVVMPGGYPSATLAERLMFAAFDTSPWIVLGAVGLFRGTAAPAVALVAAGGLLFLFAPLLGADAWGAHAMYRLGLILASAGPLAALLRWVFEKVLPSRMTGIGARLGGGPEGLGLAALLVVALPGSFLVQWNPGKLDPVAFASRDPLPANLMPAMAWIREHVPRDQACVASPDYAPSVAVLGQRRVVRAPSLFTAADDQRRRRAERMFVAGREPALQQRYTIGCLVFASGDEGWLGLRARDDLERLAGLEAAYRDRYVWIYRPRPVASRP